MNFQRDPGRDIFSVQKGIVFAVQGTIVWIHLEGVQEHVEFDLEEFSVEDQPKVKKGAAIRYETGRQRVPVWQRYSQVTVEP